jgi:hypothetical protein
MPLNPAALPPARTLRARNTALDSDNKIHDDAEARRHGYAGGLVPGVTLYAYLTQLALEAFGADWLARGTADFSVRRPVYAGEEITCSAGAAEDGALELWVRRGDALCAGGRFALAAEATDGGPPDPSALGPAARQPLPELTPTSVPLGVPLAPLVTPFSAADAARYAESTDDPNPWYRGPSPFGGALVPPGWLAARQAPLLRANFRFGPSIHVRSEVRHLAPAHSGNVFISGGVIRDAFERRGNYYLLLDAASWDQTDRVLCQVRHTTIYQVRPAADTAAEA